MRFFIVIALCLAVASANYANKNRFNRLLRDLQRQADQQEQGHDDNRDLYTDESDQDSDEQQNDDDDENIYQQRQCSRNRNNQRLNLDDDDEDQENERGDNNNERDDEDDSRQDGNENTHESGQRNQGQRRHRNQNQRQSQSQSQRRRQQQKNQCQPKSRLLSQLERPNGKLASKLYKQAKQENDDKNTVVSPAAVQLALAALQRGARGNTKRQIQRLIGAGLTKQQQRQAHAALQQSLQGQDQQQQQQQNGQTQQAKIKTTTTIIINQRSRAQQQFIQAVKACLNAQVKKCNFQRQPQQCRQQINRYVAQKTNQKLQHTVPQDAITENTKLIVVNTAQLKARWGRQFRQQQQTKQGNFYPLGCQQPKPVQILQGRGQFNYYEDDQLQVVGIPTQRQELTLYVIVPKDKQGLNEIEKQQIENGQQLRQLLDAADQQREQIDLELPKFQIKHKIDAKQTLRKQGAKDAFDQDEADLSGINGGQSQSQQQNGRRRHQNQRESDEEDQQNQLDQDDQQRPQQQLHVNKLIHQATIKIDEQGISAARPSRHQQQQQQQNQNEQDNEDDDEDQQDQDENQQLSREQLIEEIFGQQRRGQQGQRRHRRQDQDQDQDGQRKVKVNRAFAFAIKHNQSNQIVLVGRVVDATQKPKSQQQQGQGRQQQGQQSLNGVDQE